MTIATMQGQCRRITKDLIFKLNNIPSTSSLSGNALYMITAGLADISVTKKQPLSTASARAAPFFRPSFSLINNHLYLFSYPNDFLSIFKTSLAGVNRKFSVDSKSRQMSSEANIPTATDVSTKISNGTDEGHNQNKNGLWDFYDDNRRLRSNVEGTVGRAWSVRELRRKSFEDLHKLWYVLYRENNMLLTERNAARRKSRRSTQSGRRYKVKKSMGAIKVVLAERNRDRRAKEALPSIEE